VGPQEPNFELMGRPLEKSPRCLAEKLFTIIWMNPIKSRPFGLPLVDVQTEILERGVIGVERASIRPKYADVLRREVQNLPELCFLVADFVFRPFAIVDVHARSAPLDDLAGR